VIPHDTRPAAASVMDADGVCVRRATETGLRPGRWILPALALGAVVGALALLAPKDRSAAPAPSGTADAAFPTADEGHRVATGRVATDPATATMVRRPRVAPAAPSPTPDLDFTLPSTDPDDLASHFRPGDPEPTMAELIEALRDSGVREGIAAFNPPGTSPLLGGIAVPADFELPPGYVRHHQVTDQGVDVEPILMFAPDVQFFDEQGRPIAIPDDRVVPPELAPPGLPIRPVELPPEDGR
jgi:hypothetical protein